MPKVSPARTLVILLYLFLWLIYSVIGMKKQELGWDVFGYLGAVVSLETSDPQVIHNLAYGAVREGTSPEVFSSLTDIPYRRSMFESPGLFVLQLPFYTVKPLYVGALWILSKAGIPLMAATKLVSSIVAFLVALVALLWACHIDKSWRAPLWASLVCYATGVISMSRVVTPDSLSALCLLVLFYLVLTRKSCSLAGIVAILSILARPDNLLVAPPLLAILFWRGEGRGYMFWALGTLLVGGCVSYGAGAYPFSTLFHHTFVEYLVDPSQGASHFNVASYLPALKNGAISAIFEPLVIGFGVTALLATSLAWRKEGRDGNVFAVIIVLAISAGVRFILFPVAWPRFFWGHALVASLILLSELITVCRDDGEPGR